MFPIEIKKPVKCQCATIWLINSKNFAIWNFWTNNKRKYSSHKWFSMHINHILLSYRLISYCIVISIIHCDLNQFQVRHFYNRLGYFQYIISFTNGNNNYRTWLKSYKRNVKRYKFVDVWLRFVICLEAKLCVVLFIFNLKTYTHVKRL